jgi:hypothetical protein
MKHYLVATAALLAGGLGGAAQADALGLGVAAKLGTAGYGVEIGFRFNDYLAVRGGVNRGSYDYSETDAGVDYDYTFDFDNYPLLLDWHVFGGDFRLTGGVFSNSNKVTGRATGALDIGGAVYNTTATSEVTFQKSSPYVGLGWAALPSAQGGLGFSFDIGVLAHGSPTARLSAPGVPPGDIAAEEAALNEDLKDFKYWPVVSLGIGYTF